MDKLFADVGVPLSYPEGRPNIEPRDDIRITDRDPIVRAAADEPGAAELVQCRWSWPVPAASPSTTSARTAASSATAAA